jgi:uncharacterized protein YndB with AHSA1/START domain
MLEIFREFFEGRLSAGISAARPWARPTLERNMTEQNRPEIHELVLTRLIDAPREKLFRCWTEPELIKQWFAPKPYTVPVARTDLKVGGNNLIVMKSPEGQEIPCPGTYLEIVPNQKLVFTDAYTGDWVPGGKPFMTAILTFEEEDGKTRYTARVRHWNAEDLKTHEQMGFHQGWGICTDQLAELAQRI